MAIYVELHRKRGAKIQHYVCMSNDAIGKKIYLRKGLILTEVCGIITLAVSCLRHIVVKNDIGQLNL